MIAFRMGMNGGYRIPPNARNMNTGSVPPPVTRFRPGLAFACAGAAALVAYQVFQKKEEEEGDRVDPVTSLDLCKVETMPSIISEAEKNLVAYTLARTSDVSCRHIIYNMILMGEIETDKGIDFLLQLVKESTHPEATEYAKENLARWLILLKRREGSAHQDLLIRLDKEGYLPWLFQENRFQKNHEGIRIMRELHTEYLDLRHKKLI